MISDEEIINISKEAMEEGVKNNRVEPLKSGRQNKMIVRGQTIYKGKLFKFEGIKNLETGEIESAYPVIEWKGL